MNPVLENHVLDLGWIMSDQDIACRLQNVSVADFKNQALRFSDYSQLYAFATENIAGYFPSLQFAKSSVLTVGASADHIINAYLLGAGNVTAFDVNVLAGLYCDLKLAAIERFSFDKFRSFLFRAKGTNKEALDFGTYAHLKEALTKPTKLFFDRMYAAFHNDGYLLRNSVVFNTHYDFDDLKIMSNLYLQSEQAYDEARDALRGKKTRWIHGSLFDVSRCLGKTCDIILLSNIADYAKMTVPAAKYLEAFSKWQVGPLRECLTADGIICAAYIYNVRAIPDEHAVYRTDVDDPEKRREVFSALGMDYEELCFPSVIPNNNDAVIKLRRRTK
jgi:hypothetical protein